MFIGFGFVGGGGGWLCVLFGIFMVGVWGMFYGCMV